MVETLQENQNAGYKDGAVFSRDLKALVDETVEDNVVVLIAWVIALPVSLIIRLGIGVILGMIPSLALMAWSVIVGGSWNAWWVFLPVAAGGGICGCITLAGFAPRFLAGALGR